MSSDASSNGRQRERERLEDAEDRGDEKAADDEKVEAGIADPDGDVAEE